MDRQSMIGGGGGGTPATVVGIASYTALRAGTFTGIDALILTDPTKPGLFVPAPAGSRDNGGTVIHDAGGNLWAREFSGRVNAGWFYDCPGHHFGDGSGVKITNLDVEANPQWVGLADDGYAGGQGSVQSAQSYPVGTYWDFVALQEWVYACAAERSVPQATFIGSITGAILTVSEWLSGGALGVGQLITGSNVQPDTYVTDGFGGDTYGVGQYTYTAGFTITTATSTFRGFVEGSLLTVDAFYTGPPISYGDVILSPLNPPAGQYNGVLPGTTILTQVRQVGDAPGGLGDYNVGVVQASVPSEQMVGSGGPNWNSNGNNNYRNLKGEVPRGVVSLNQMLVINGNGLDLSMGSAKLATSMFWHGNATGTVPTGPAIKFNSLAYGYVENLTVTDQSSGVVGYLVSLSHVAGVPGLNVENNTFRDWVIGGNYVSSECGIAVSPEGGSAQGDTQTFIDCWVTGFLDGWLIGGDNAIAVTFLGGQTQACPRKGINDAGGSFGSFNFLTENNTASYFVYPQQNQITLGGADFYCQQVGTEACLSMGTRSESLVGMIDLNRSSSLHNWTCGGFLAEWKANAHWLPGYLIAAGTIFTQDEPQPTNPNWGFYAALLADDGGWPWFESDPSSTQTHIVNPNSPGWTANEWVGGGCWFRNAGNGDCSDTSIVASDANSITLSSPSGFTTPTSCKVFKLSGAAKPSWAACPRFGQFPRNESGWGATIAAGFNLITSDTLENIPQPLAGDWVCLPGAAVVSQPGGPSMVGPLVGRIENHTAAVTGYFIQAFGDVATIWGAPTGPIHLGTFPSALTFNPLVGQLSGTPGGVGDYQLEFSQTVGAQFTGSITGNELQVTSVQQGSLSAGEDVGGAGIAVSPLSIASLGALITGHIDNGAGAAGTTLTVQSVIGGAVQLGAPVTTNIGPALSANSVIYQQLSGPAGGVGTYSISTEDGLPQLAGSASFTGSVAGNVLTTTGTTGKVVIGMLLLGAGVPAGTWITYQASGPAGGDGTYNLSNGGMSIAAEAMTTTWSLTIGGHAATFVGHIDDGAGGFGNLLTVTSITSGKLDVGQTVNVPVTGGVAGQTQTMKINGKGTGTGGAGTYTVSGSAVLIASQTMTANTTGGVGFYVLDATLGSPISSEAMTAGPASVTQPTWALQDVHGNPQNAAVTQVDGTGYWSAPIADGPLTWMAIDFDQLFGVGAVRQCQLNLGKITNCNNVELPSQSGFGQLQGQFIRPGGRGPSADFIYHGGKQTMYAAPTAFFMTANPFEMPAGGFFAGGMGSQPTIKAITDYPNQTVDMPLMGSGLCFDQDILFVPEAAFAGGGVITWGANVSAPTATINIGQTNGAMVRMKWVGNNFGSASGVAPGGTWYVTSVTGPYP